MNMNKAKMINDAVMSTAVRKAEERGIERGIKQGIEHGIERGKLEDAFNFLKMGLSVEQVVEGTGLPIEEVERIRNDLL